MNTPYTVSEHHPRRLPIRATLALALAFALCGCSNRAHNDLYRQRMASEIRVLEDQLYDADYQNQVLRDKLSGCKPCEQPSEARTPSGEAPAAESSDATTMPRVDIGTEEVDMGAGLDSPDDLGLPSLDEGEPVDPDSLMDPQPLLDPEPESVTPDGIIKGVESDQPGLRPPAPGGPEPPSKRDTEIPQIDPGEIVPPPAKDDGGTSKPRGQIQLPDSVQAGVGIPAKLRVHKGLSGGRRIEDNIEDMVIVLTAVDSLGKPVNIDDFDIDASLSIVILDPEMGPSEARVGRWDFTAWQVATFIRRDPVSGLHVPIEWQDLQPSGKEIIVHARLSTEDEEMRCEGRLSVLKKPAVAQWAPRGSDKKR